MATQVQTEMHADGSVGTQQIVSLAVTPAKMSQPLTQGTTSNGTDTFDAGSINILYE